MAKVAAQFTISSAKTNIFQIFRDFSHRPTAKANSGCQKTWSINRINCKSSLFYRDFWLVILCSLFTLAKQADSSLFSAF